MFTKSDKFGGKFQLLIGGGPTTKDKRTTLDGFTGCIRKVYGLPFSARITDNYTVFLAYS